MPSLGFDRLSLARGTSHGSGRVWTRPSSEEGPSRSPPSPRHPQVSQARLGQQSEPDLLPPRLSARYPVSPSRWLIGPFYDLLVLDISTEFDSVLGKGFAFALPLRLFCLQRSSPFLLSSLFSQSSSSICCVRFRDFFLVVGNGAHEVGFPGYRKSRILLVSRIALAFFVLFACRVNEAYHFRFPCRHPTNYYGSPPWRTGVSAMGCSSKQAGHLDGTGFPRM
ncbi:hypothetical protein EV126DRAFT_153587 [Verticillium dahliae]|nr:hypothetical protein EV126DRAFT_153587 [Verticillium dahliae]